MSETWAVPTAVLDEYSGAGRGRPLCPACTGGRLHPFKVSINLGVRGFQGITGLEGWTVVCAGTDPLDSFPAAGPCGFSMPMQPVRNI